jgi:hypothetical protein
VPGDQGCVNDIEKIHVTHQVSVRQIFHLHGRLQVVQPSGGIKDGVILCREPVERNAVEINKIV